MRRFGLSCVIAFAVVLTASTAPAETTHRFGGSFDLGFPQDKFRDNVDNTGIGGGLFLTIGLPDMPLAVGASIDFLRYGSETREAPWSQTIPDVFLDVKTTHDLLAGHLSFRVQPAIGFFEPYMEALIGFHYLWTKTSVSDQDSDSEEIASTTHISSLAFSYGVGAGVMFRVYDVPRDYGAEGAERDPLEDIESVGTEKEGEIDLRSVGIFLDLRYLRGGEADYLTEGAIHVEDGKVRYDIRHSRTDIIIMRIGISFNIR